MAKYILRWRPTAYDLVGPFETTEELVDWASSQANNPGGDARWAQIELHSTAVGDSPMIHTPSEASKYAAAGQDVGDDRIREGYMASRGVTFDNSEALGKETTEPMRQGSEVVSTGQGDTIRESTLGGEPAKKEDDDAVKDPADVHQT